VNAATAMSTRAPKICQTCHRVLDFFERPALGIARYQHAARDAALGHEAVPVDPQPGQTRGRCDFCGADDPGFTLPVASFVMPGSGDPGYASEGDWAACAECAARIRDGAWARLGSYVIGTMISQGEMPSREECDGIRAIHEMVRARVTGPLVPVPDGERSAE
jgi:hypothetical protein